MAPGPIARRDWVVEPDLSNATPFLAAAAVTGGTVAFPGWPGETTQPGDGIRDVLTRMGCEVALTDGTLVVRGARELSGVDIDLRDVSELTPTIAAVAALATGRSTLRGVAHIRGHETDRLAALVAEINGLGGRAEETEDGLTIRPGAAARRHLARLRRPPDGDGGRDHRPGGARRRGGRHRLHGEDHARFPRAVGGVARVSPAGKRQDWSKLDESDVRVRPGKGTRPRSKRRPEHADAQEAMVVGVDRGRWTCAMGGDPGQLVTAMRARELGRTPIVVGDRVDLVGDVSGTPDTLSRIVRVAERTSVLRRTADDTDPFERVVVANAAQLMIVCALADPPPRTGFIDRCLVAAYAGGLTPVLCLTKADLASPDELLASYAELALPVLVTRHDEEPDALRERLTDQVSALVGHSGVGKSTLVNRLLPDQHRAVGEVSGVGKGRHTSTTAVALPLPTGGWVVDTPGIRSFGLAHIKPDDIVGAFDEFGEAAEECPNGCGHLGAPEDPDCALDDVVVAGTASTGRLASLRRLLYSKAGLEETES